MPYSVPVTEHTSFYDVANCINSDRVADSSFFVYLCRGVGYENGEWNNLTFDDKLLVRQSISPPLSIYANPGLVVNRVRNPEYYRAFWGIYNAS